jgi:hypothetical protein
VDKPDLSAAVDACRSLISQRFRDDDHHGYWMTAFPDETDASWTD